MSYTLELWAVAVADVEAELASPSLRPYDDDTMPDALWQRWDELAAEVAAMVGAGGGKVGDQTALYVHAVVRALGAPYGDLSHTSSGGEDFRRRFLRGPAAKHLGAEFVGYLIDRELAGLNSYAYPLFGWASVEELREAATRAEAAAGSVEVALHDIEPLYVLVRAVRQAARMGIDLVAAYG